MAHRRGNGEGSIYQREIDGRWFGSIVVGFDTKGRQKRRTVSAKSRREVVSKLTKLQRDISDGLSPQLESISLAQLLTRWHEDVLPRQVKESAQQNYWSVARIHLIPILGAKKLSALTTLDVDGLLAAKARQGCAPSTVRRVRAVLCQALDQGVRWGYVTRNVAKLSRSPKLPRREGRTMSSHQVRLFLKALSGHPHESLYALMLATGLRRGEALGLRWDDYDKESGTMQVRRQLQRLESGLVAVDTKTSTSRRSVNLPRGIVGMLETRREQQAEEAIFLGQEWINSGYIFTTKFGTPLDPRNLLREFKGICEDAGLGDWHIHELRHSAASLMLAQGVKIQVVSDILGHASIRMTADVYGHILAPDRHAAAETMNNLLFPDEAFGI
jgi:integrase